MLFVMFWQIAFFINYSIIKFFIFQNSSIITKSY